MDQKERVSYINKHKPNKAARSDFKLTRTKTVSFEHIGKVSGSIKDLSDFRN